MSSCDAYEGTVLLAYDVAAGQVLFVMAHPMVHVVDAETSSPVTLELIEELYVLRERCPAQEHMWHAVRRERPLRRWSAAEVVERLRASGPQVLGGPDGVPVIVGNHWA